MCQRAQYGTRCFHHVKTETGYHNMLVITDRTQGVELYRGNLLGNPPAEKPGC